MRFLGFELGRVGKASVSDGAVSARVLPQELLDVASGAGGVDPSMGPGVPMEPTHQEEGSPRRFDYQPGRNIINQPRAYEPVTFDTLRRLCDSYDVARIAIEARKDEARGWDWDVRVKPVRGLDRAAQKARATSFADEVARVRGFLMSPNQEDDFGTWLTMYLEDLFVIDAPTLYIRRTRGGDLYALEVVDGATMRPLIDAWGRLPQPPLPAYGQTIKGVTWGYYSRDEIIYEPYHQSATSPYGSPPMTWVLMAVNRALRRQSLDLSQFTEGSAPTVGYMVPEGWTATQINELQDLLDTLLTADDAGRSRFRLLPGGNGAGIFQLFPEPKTEAEQWLMHVTAAAFGTSAYELGFEPAGSGLGGAGFGEASRASAEKRGSRPLAAHLKGLLDRIIAGPLGMPELEFAWLGMGQAEDLVKEAQRDREYWEMGAISTDEVREKLGRDPIGLGPTLVDAKLGIVLVSDMLGAIATSELADATIEGVPMVDPVAPVTEPSVPSASPGEIVIGEPVDGPADVAKAAAAEDIARWRTKAVKAVRTGRDPARFTSDAIDPDTAAALRVRLGGATSPADVRAAFEEVLA